MDKPVRIGLLGPGRIVDRVMKDFGNVRGGIVTAVASRSYDRAEAAAEKYGAAHAYGSYAALAKSDEVDLIYIATPHNFHAGQAIEMMEQGKHVLCEKPMALNHLEVERMAECARRNGVFLMEAMWTRFFPASKKIAELVEGGAIGEVTHIFADFACAADYDPTSRLFDPALAGGTLLDLGVYPIMAATMLLGYDFKSVQGLCALAPSGVDMRASVQAQFASGATAQMLCGADVYGESREIIYGTRGRINVPNFWHPTRFTLSSIDGEVKEFVFAEEREGHAHEFTHACECIKNGLVESPYMTHAESIAVSRMCTELREQWGVIYPGER